MLPDLHYTLAWRYWDAEWEGILWEKSEDLRKVHNACISLLLSYSAGHVRLTNLEW